MQKIKLTAEKVVRWRNLSTDKLKIAKKIIEENFEDAKYGIFGSRNIVGDVMYNVYDKDGLTIDICYGYGYFEVFGLTDEEFEKLEEYYKRIKGE